MRFKPTTARRVGCVPQPAQRVRTVADYERMASVLARSVAATTPGATCTIHTPTMPRIASAIDRPWAAPNTFKHRCWTRIVDSAPDDALILLLDADMLVTADLRPIADVVGGDCDICYTDRPKGDGIAINSGTIIVRANERSRAFMHQWRANNERMCRDKALWQRYSPRYGRINQAALGMTLDAGTFDATVIAAPCRIWNCQQTHWKYFSAETRIVHLLSPLREFVLAEQERADLVPPGQSRHIFRAIRNRWRTMESSL